MDTLGAVESALKHGEFCAVLGHQSEEEADH